MRNRNRLSVLIMTALLAVVALVGAGVSRDRMSTPVEVSEPFHDNEILAPVFSEQSGFFDEPFPLSLTAEPGTKIYYTLDNTTPTEASALYTGPLLIEDASPNPNVASAVREISASSDVYIPDYPVDKCNVVKAVAVDKSGVRSEVATGVYFVGFQGKEGYSGVSIMSLSLEPEDLFGERTGIYYGRNGKENYKERGRDWERPALMTYFDSNKEYAFTQGIGVRIQGNGSRAYSQRSFNLYARNEYSGTDYFTVALFSDMPEHSCTLSNGGNSEAEITKLREVVNQQLVSNRAIAWKASHPCILFLNGEFWGIYNLQERFDAAYFNRHYGVSEESIVVWQENAGENKIDIGQPEDEKLVEELRAFFINTDLSNSGNYRQAQKYIDIQSFIEYVSAEIYMGNFDWPSSNFRMWRVRNVSDKENEDGKWRFMLFDTDGSASYYKLSKATSDNFGAVLYADKLLISEQDTVTLLFRRLLQSEVFRKQFQDAFLDMAANDLAYERAHLLLYGYADIYAQPMEQFYKRFTVPSSGKDRRFFYDQVQIIDTFFRDRGQFICGYMMQHMDEAHSESIIDLLRHMDIYFEYHPGSVVQAAFFSVAALFGGTLIFIDARENRRERIKHGT